MDCSTQQQQQQQNHDPAEAQAYDQSTQAYYEFHQYNQYIQQQQYPYCTTHDYTNPHQQTHQEPTSIYPPGVHITPEQTHLQNQQLGQTHVQDQYNSYYPQGFVDQQPLQQQVNGGGLGPQPPIGPTTYAGGGRRGGRPFRGGGPGRFGSRPNGSGPPLRGRGRGRGHGGRFRPPADNATACAQGESSQTPVWPPPRMAWCELCRVDCNTPEILEQHKNGKRHKKNLQVFEEFHNRRLVAGQNEKNEGSENKPPPTGGKQVETEQEKVSGEAELTEEPETKPGKDHFGGQERGLKRKMRGGWGGKFMRIHEGSRRPVEPPKPKQVIPFVCELCNVKCESQVVFDSHLAGKKHISNHKRFQEQQAMLEQAALQALYPALLALYPALQALYPPDPNASTSFGHQFHQEGVHGSQGTFPLLAPSMVPSGQASAPELGPTSESAQPSGAKTEAELTSSAKTESENGTLELEPKEGSRKTDNSVVEPLADAVTGAD
ncbi:uncharacterized protein LOC130778083 [Actinidia eriantha]|uniref:uncharacterized protein LOC130778083 n=1 Tax=Actinidia eriantha TaxID=165200 RepID=UPI0025840D98|nr:uncharacterized protein LOC130778083 [Actinidia eriantha]